MTEPLNAHGDRLIATTNAHGADIACQRIDALDSQALTHLLNLLSCPTASPPVCVDLGCGLGWQGARFAWLGARSYLYDRLPVSAVAQGTQASGAALSYRVCDLNRLRTYDLPSPIALAFSQRCVHYLHPRAARRLLRRVAARMAPQGLFFLSVSGMSSELGHGYPAAAVPWERRFARLAPPMQAKHGIAAPVCLYDQEDLVALMASASFESLSIWSSPFGNIKGVFRRTR